MEKNLNIKYFKKIGSTNSFSMKNIDVLQNADVIVADCQSEGRGRLGRAWISDNTDNVYLTIVLKPEEGLYSAYPFHNITQYMAVVLSDLLDDYLLDTGLKSQIKWPNDVLIEGKKIAGILAESVSQGSVMKGYMLGLGVNLNMSKKEIELIDQPASSLNIITGKIIDKKCFIKQILKNFFYEYDLFVKKGFSYIEKSYKMKAVFAGRSVLINIAGKKIKARVMDINNDGSITIKKDNGDLENLITGEIVCY
ncbi:MAG: biotin--[acetyl-CoA-carboxylase] ligase [bacterium]|nr:biotin--[acetyl-CoA-carboxylase] ligase [bacterium]